jgi:hypothetical protein
MKKSIKNFKDSRGILFSFQNKNFKIKRIFFIKGYINATRGKHAHKDTKQIIINIDAKVMVKTFVNSKKKTYFLRNSGDYLICNKKTWVEIKFLKSGYLSVVCDKIYDKKDYIYDINKLKK